ncbi:hypothetical protein JW978_03520 [Candidatus Dojkabacteria bacterium]|nr:hypothetical protein [Candidatus Dojkabacteria bacterium]
MSTSNNDKSIFQVPMVKTLREKAEEKAEKEGFSSLQELTRVFLSGYVNGVYNVFIDSRERLSPEAAARYKHMIEEHEGDRKRGKVRSYTAEESIKALS